jgi:hypothetical protein
VPGSSAGTATTLRGLLHADDDAARLLARQRSPGEVPALTEGQWTGSQPAAPASSG